MEEYKKRRQELAENEPELYKQLIEAENKFLEAAFLNTKQDNSHVKALREALFKMFDKPVKF